MSAAAETAQGVFGDELSLEETLRRYLSVEHVAHPERGCVVAALGSEGAHQPVAVRRAFSEVARGLINLVERKLHAEKRSHAGRAVAPSRAPSDDALRLTSAMVGAVLLARLVDDSALAERLLRAVRALPTG